MTKTKTRPAPALVENPIAVLETKVAALTRDVHLSIPEEQRAIRERQEEARRRLDNAAFAQAGDALEASKRRRNARIDELEHTRGLLAEAKREVDRRVRAATRAEMLERAVALTTSSSAELLEEQARIPARLAEATKNIDLDLVRRLRQRQTELPELIYAARMVETGQSIEAHRARAEDGKAKAAALETKLAAAEEQLTAAQAERDRLIDEISLIDEIKWAQAELMDSSRAVVDAERQMVTLAGEASRPEAPVVRSRIGWNPAGAA